MTKARFILLTFFLLIVQVLVAQTSVKSGNWDDSTLWNTGAVPASGATVIINYGHTVTRSGSLSLASLTVRTGLSVTGDVVLTGALDLANGSSFGVTGSMTLPGNFNHNGVVSIGSDCRVGGTVMIVASGSLNFTVGGNLLAGGTINNNGHVEIAGSCTSQTGRLNNAAGCGFSVGGSLIVQTGLTNSGTMEIGGNCTVAGGGLTNVYDRNLTIGGDLTVSGGTTNQGLFVVNGDFSLLTGDLSVSFSELLVVNGAFTKSGNVNLDGMLIVSGDFISTGGSTTINQYNGNFYAFSSIDENGAQAGCTESCFPKESCATCKIKGLASWNSDGKPGEAFVVFATTWWEDHLSAIGESAGPEKGCPGHSMNFSVQAVTAAVGDLSLNTFEWAVYGGTITGFNGTSVQSQTGTVSGHTASYQSVHGIASVNTYTLEVQWEPVQFDGAYVAVRQTSAYGCSDGLWSVFHVDIDVVSAPTGSENQSFCSFPLPTVADLSATGTSVQWYTSPSGGLPLNTGTALTNGYYYASQSVNGCESIQRLAVHVTIVILPDATIFYPGSPFCQATRSAQPVTFSGTTGGTFSAAPSGLTIDPATGTIMPFTSMPGDYVVTYTIPAYGNCGEVKVSTEVSIKGYLSWNGSVSTNWNLAGNWSCGLIPDLTTDVRISSVPNQPVLSTGPVGAVRNILLESGSSLTVTGNTLQIAGTISNSGTFTASAGTIEMKGSSAQLMGADVFANNRILNLTVNNPAGVTLQGPLDITGIVFPNSGNLSSQGNLTLISTATQTALIDGSGTGTVQGNVTIQRYLPAGFGYKYVSSPVQSATVNEFADDLDLAASFPVFYLYDEDNHSDSAGISRYSSGWVKYLSGTLEPLKGYAANFGSSTNPKTIDITGVVNNNISASLTLYNHNRLYTKGFNLVGNPYPSPIDWDAAGGWTRNNIDNALYYFDAGSTQYTGIYSTYINGTSSNGFANGKIAAMQGFFVHVSDGAYPVTGTLAMTNAVRINDLNPNFHKSASQNFRPLIRLSAGFEDDGSAADPTVIYFDELATTLFNRDRDALKMLNTDEQVPSLYSVSDDHRWLSINGIPYRGDTLSVIPLGIQTLKPGWVEFKTGDIENLPIGMRVYLHDSETGMNQDLQQSLRYRSYLMAGDHNNRFWLKLSLIDLAEMPDSKNSFFAFSSGDDLRVKLMLGTDENALLSVCNLSGQVVWRLDVSGMGYSEVSQALSTGIYLVSLHRSSGIQSQKVYVPNR